MKCAWVVLATVVLVGCAPLSPPLANQSGGAEIDYARMAAVGRAARAGGVQLVWINAPRKAGS